MAWLGLPAPTRASTAEACGLSGWGRLAFLKNALACSVRLYSMASLSIPDLRRPGEPMRSLPLKIPADALQALQVHAEQMKCSRSALARALLLQRLEQLGPRTASFRNESET